MARRQPCGLVRHVVLVVALLVILTALVHPKAIHSLAGPFRIIPGHLEHCPPEVEAPVPIEFHVRGVRTRQNLDVWYYSGNFTTQFTWTNNHDIDVNFASWSSRGGWKDNFYVMRARHYCSSLKAYAPNAYRQLMLAINDDANYSNCNWPPGSYHVRNMSTDFKVKAVPVLFYGKWRITMRLMKNDYTEVLGCIRAYADTVPRV